MSKGVPRCFKVFRKMFPKTPSKGVSKVFYFEYPFRGVRKHLETSWRFLPKKTGAEEASRRNTLAKAEEARAMGRPKVEVPA